MTPSNTKILALAGALLLLPALGGVAGAQPGEPSRQLELVAFSDDGKEFALKVVDIERGSMFEVRDSKKNEVVARYPFDEGTEKKAWRKAKKKHDLKFEPEGPENKKKDVTLMSTQKGDKLNIYVMRGEAIKKYTDIPLLVPTKQKKGDPAESLVKMMAWGPKGKYVVVVYHQKLMDMFEWEGDFVHAFKFRSYKVKFDEAKE